MERRALIAGMICIVIILVYQAIVVRLYPPPDPTLNAPIEAPIEAPAGAPQGEPASSQSAPPMRVEPASTNVVEGQDVVVDTSLYHAVFTTAGARLKSFQLKRFRTTVDPTSPLLDLMSQAVPADRPLGIELRGGDEKQITAVSDTGVLYSVDRQAIELQDGNTGAVTFTGEVRGARIVKRIQATADSYLFDVTIRAENLPAEFTELGVGWNKQVEDVKVHGGEIVFNSDVMLQAGKIHRELFTALKEPLFFKDNIQWTGYDGHYFLAAMVPGGDGTNNLRVWLQRSGDKLESKLLLPSRQFEFTMSAFLGPKDVDVLTRSGHELERAVDLGYFAFVAKPLFQVLKFLYRFTGNYGVDIILLTIAIKILFIPLTQKSLKSMREMQKLQPQMQQLKERYKDKPDEMNKEVMELYRRHKVNPLGGCLPMVLQIPVFIGLYNALSNAVELRHAPFMLWINDLSAPDRLGTFQLPFVDRPGFPVLTLLMGGTMFLQQWMTPSTADPAQQRVMLIMPVMFTVMFINFPSGLTLYWLVNNILTITQQYWINRSKE